MAANNPNRNKVQINIIGDDTELDESLKDSETLIQAFGKRVVTSLQQVTYVAAELKDQLVTTFLKGADAVTRFTLNIKDSTMSLDAFAGAWEKTKLYFETLGLEIQEFILQNRSLSKTIELTGKSAGYSAQSLQQYADYLEKTTSYSADATKSAMQLIMHFRNIHGEQFLAATKSAQDLATELRTDLNSAAQLVGESLNDPITALQRLSAVNIFFTKSEEAAIKSAMRLNKVADAQDLILNKLIQSYGGAAKEAGETFTGKVERLRNVLHSVGTRIGEAVYNKINKISEVLFKNKNIFDALIDKISRWGQIAVHIVYDVTGRIADFVIKNKTKFIELFDWLVDKTLKVAMAIPQVFSMAVEILSTLNTFIFDSFVKTWNGISKIFTDILPASYKYMKDVFNNTVQTLTQNAAIFWFNFKEFAETATHNIWIELLKLKAQIIGWFDVITRVYSLWKEGILSGKDLKDVLIYAMTGEIDKLDVAMRHWKDILNPIRAGKAVSEGLGIKNALESMEKQTGALDSYKKEWKSVSDLLKGAEFKSPFDNTILPSLKGSIDLTKEWSALMSGISSTMNKDFDNVDERVKNIKAYFDKFIKDVKDKAEGIKEPRLDVENKRREDERRGNFANKVVSGLEEFWYKGQSAEDKNTKAVEENTKTLKEQRDERKKQVQEEKKSRQDMVKENRQKYLERTGRVKNKEQENEEEKERRLKKQQMQRRIYGISDEDIERLEYLKKKEKQAHASGNVLKTSEYQEIRDLEARRRSRDIHLNNFNNKELREAEQERLRQKARLNRISDRKALTDENKKANERNRENNKQASKSEMTKDSMKVAIKDGNKESVSELQKVAKNTERLSKFFEQMAVI